MDVYISGVGIFPAFDIVSFSVKRGERFTRGNRRQNLPKTIISTLSNLGSIPK